jgi:type II secretory pathway pseudopilin PulG
MVARRGLTLMEVVIGTLLVGLVLAATLEMIGPTVRSSRLAGEKTLARWLADQMADEIAVLPYEDPTSHAGVLGRESGESPGSRTALDDVDDFRGWSAAPIRGDGNTIDGLSGTWSMSVSVEWVVPGDPNSVLSTESGVKRIIVTASLNGTVLAERVFLRTSGFDLARAE